MLAGKGTNFDRSDTTRALRTGAQCNIMNNNSKHNFLYPVSAGYHQSHSDTPCICRSVTTAEEILPSDSQGVNSEYPKHSSNASMDAIPRLEGGIAITAQVRP